MACDRRKMSNCSTNELAAVNHHIEQESHEQVKIGKTRRREGRQQQAANPLRLHNTLNITMTIVQSLTFVLIFFSLLFGTGNGIRIVAPDYIFFGDSFWLNCTVPSAEYNQIYSIKWFKDNQEMYRYITGDESPATFYHANGVQIDEQKSKFGNIFVRKANFKTASDFRCEVLNENDFNTAIEIKTVQVYYIPQNGQPIIFGKKHDFVSNELVNLTCTAPMSIPSARLMVTLNGASVSSNGNFYQRTHQTTYDSGLVSSSVNVQFPSQWLDTEKKNEFQCTSSIVHRFNRTASMRLDLRTSEVNRSISFYQSSTTASNNFPTEPLAPRIENVRARYELGEVITLRCISASYKPMPELYWLVDGVPVEGANLEYKQSDYHHNGFVRLDLRYRLGQHQTHSGSRLRHGKGVPRSPLTHSDNISLKCVQVLSDVISVSNEVTELYNSPQHANFGNSLERNSAEEVRSFTGNGARIQFQNLLHFFLFPILVAIFFQTLL